MDIEIGNIEIGSKWVRVKMSEEDEGSERRFIGQEVLVVPFPPAMPRGLRNSIWVKRKYRDGKMSNPVWIGRADFIRDFQPLIISLENK